MVPVFGKDMPDACDCVYDDEDKIAGASERKSPAKSQAVVGFRMPYDWPVVPYAASDTPWSPGRRYAEPDWMGAVWTGY